MAEDLGIVSRPDRPLTKEETLELVAECRGRLAQSDKPKMFTHAADHTWIAEYEASHDEPF